MTLFLALGIAGLVLVAASLIIGDLLDGVLDGLLDALDADWISTAVIGGFVSAFGFGAAAVDAAGAPWPVAVGVGALSGVVVGWFAWWLTRLLKDGPSDGTVTIADTVGQLADVVTPIPEQGYGVIRVRIGGHTLTYNASASGMAIEAGRQVNVTGVLSPTAVQVNAVWSPDA
ncbi:hypothetical protein FXB39_03090 [Nocardioides sp. BGMRC 2183]|nr:hypothetical protein FXB39_03090 [Nocardioides sp. BGMRC 2183]